MKVKVISLPYIFQVLYVLCFTRPRYQVSVYRTIGPLVYKGKRKLQVVHTRIRTNCSALNSDLFRKNIVDSPSCTCGAMENAYHF